MSAAFPTSAPSPTKSTIPATAIPMPTANTNSAAPPPPPPRRQQAGSDSTNLLRTDSVDEFTATTTMPTVDTAADPNVPFVTVAPVRGTGKLGSGKGKFLRPTTIGRTAPSPINTEATTTSPNSPIPSTTTSPSKLYSAASRPPPSSSTGVAEVNEEASPDDGLNGDTLRNGTAGGPASYNRELQRVPGSAVFSWIQQFATNHFSCRLCGDFLGACSAGVVMVSDSANLVNTAADEGSNARPSTSHLMCRSCRYSDSGLASFPNGVWGTSEPPLNVLTAIDDLRQMLTNPLSAVVDAATVTPKTAASNSNYYNSNGFENNSTPSDDEEEEDDERLHQPTPASSPMFTQQRNAGPTLQKEKSRFVNPNDESVFASDAAEGGTRNNTTFSSPLAKKKSLQETTGSPNTTQQRTTTTTSTPINNDTENERPTTDATSPAAAKTAKLAAETPAAPPSPAPSRRLLADLRVLQAEEENLRTRLNVEEGIAFVNFEKRAAGNVKLIRSQKRGSSKQLKIEADEAYEKAKYHIAIDLYDRAIEQVGDGTARLSVLYGNRSAALFMAMRYEDCIEDCLRVAAKHQQQQNAATGGHSGEGGGVAPQQAAMNGMVKMYQRAIKAATMMGDLERALTLYNKIDASATTEQMNTDRMKVMMAVDELRDAKKLHCTPEGDRLWEILISKFGDALMFRVKYAESLAAAGKLEKAVDVLSIVQPPSRPAHIAQKIALYKYRSGFEHFENARETLEPFVRTDDECMKLLKLIDAVDEEKQRGNQLFSSRQFAASVTHYTRAIDLDAQNDRILRILFCNRAAAFKELGKLQEGVDDCTRAIALDSNFSKAYARRARCLMNMKEYDGAVRDFKHASKCDPADRELGRELKNAEDYLAKEVEKEKDLYYILGVTKAATEAEVKKKYRELSLKWHPDKCMAQTEDEKLVSERKFKAVSEAYSVLMSVEKRREYDLKCDRERYTSAYAGYGGSSAFSGASAAGGYRSSASGGTGTAASGAYRGSGASRWSKYGAGGAAGSAGGPGTAGGTGAGFW